MPRDAAEASHVSVQLNHTVVSLKTTQRGRASSPTSSDWRSVHHWDRSFPVVLSNDVTLDFYTVPGHTEALAHYAFLVSEAEFDRCLDRLRRADVEFYSGPRLDRAGEINHQDGGRGLYFLDPTGNTMEIITRPYGQAPAYRERG
jgi:catechol 2,3-dioxygenase-like lactoylglutathione lyase family enzyme